MSDDDIVKLPYCDEVLQKLKSLHPINFSCYNTLIKDDTSGKRFLQINFTKINNLWSGEISRKKQEIAMCEGFIEQLNSSNIITEQLLRAVNRFLYGAKIKSIDIGFLTVGLNNFQKAIELNINKLTDEQIIIAEFREWCDSYNCNDWVIIDSEVSE